MTGSGRQDFLLVALIASLVAHVALMAFMRPQVMTHVTGEWTKRRAHGPMKVTESAERPDPVAMESVTDVDAVRESPDAAAEALLPAAATLDAPGQEQSVSAPEFAPPAPDVADVSFELAPSLSEVIHVDAASPAGFSARLPREGLPSVPLAPASAASAPEADHLEETLPAPAFEAPAFTPDFRDGELASSETDASPKPERLPQVDAYVPPKEVLEHVDEQIVEAEKAAVRGLLDVRDADELAKFVDVAATSASSGGWTYFRVMLNPRSTLPVVPKDVVVLMDASGSIGEDRLRSCQAAARKILRSCTNTDDRFNLVAFRDRFTYAFREWQPCTKSAFNKADRWLGTLAAHGRTDVFAVIRSVLTLPRDPARPLIALVVTDGDANSGVKETSEILSKFSELNDGLVSVYMYGVKEGANRELIDVLTHGNRGESFIYGGTRWHAGEGIEGLSERFRDPVLSDLRIVFSSDVLAEAYPRLLKNLYRGETVDFVGRVPDGVREVSFSLRGLNGDKPYEGFFRVDLAASKFDETLPSAWGEERSIDKKLQ